MSDNAIKYVPFHLHLRTLLSGFECTQQNFKKDTYHSQSCENTSGCVRSCNCRHLHVFCLKALIRHFVYILKVKKEACKVMWDIRKLRVAIFLCHVNRKNLDPNLNSKLI